jgi:hypothetical protein
LTSGSLVTGFVTPAALQYVRATETGKEVLSEFLTQDARATKRADLTIPTTLLATVLSPRGLVDLPRFRAHLAEVGVTTILRPSLIYRRLLKSLNGWGGRRTIISASTLVLRPELPINIRYSRKSWQRSNPT